MKVMKKVISILLITVILVSSVIISSPAAYAASDGITFTQNDFYRSEERPASLPRTIEVWVKVNQGATGPDNRLGVLVGNYQNEGIAAYSLEIRNNKNPYFYWNNGTTAYTADFTNIDLRTGTWTHVAVVRNTDNKSVTCYINGSSVQTVTSSTTGAFADFTNRTDDIVCVGGDLRGTNARYLQNAAIRSVSMFSDVRTAAEITSDKNEIPHGANSLLCSYEFNTARSAKYVDQSDNANHLVYSTLTSARATNGMSFSATNFYTGTKQMEHVPMIFMATVRVPTTTQLNSKSNKRGGVILGSYGSSGNAVNFELHENGVPRLYLEHDGVATDFMFSNLPLTTNFSGQVVHITIAVGDTDVRCYINGKNSGANYYQTVTKAVASMKPSIAGDPLALGGDYRSGNSNYFTGEIFNAAIYFTARTDDQIASDATKMMSTSSATPDLTEMLMYYSTPSVSTYPALVNDLRGNGYTLEHNAHTCTYSMYTNYEQHWYECDCGAIQSTGKADHTHTLKTSSTEHWYSCSVCGTEKLNSRAAHSGGTATCQEQAICTDCNTKYGSLGGHSYDETAWGYQGEDGHAHLCTVPNCEEKDITVAHAYDNACDIACNTCGYTRTTTHTYDNDCDTICNVCSATRTVTHNYTTKKTDATNHWYECSVCGAVDESTREAHEYDYVCDASCNKCQYVREVQHSYSTLKYNNIAHWYECVCGTKNNVTNHTYGEDDVCDVCNYNSTYSHTTKVVYGVDIEYRLIIPVVFTLSKDEPCKGTVSIANAIINDGTSVQVFVSSQLYSSNSEKNWTMQHTEHKEAMSFYTITSAKTGEKIASGDKILDVAATAASGGATDSVELLLVVTKESHISGEYKDIITFTTAIYDPNGSN